MKVTVENDKGERKEFKCDGLALVMADDEDVTCMTEGKLSHLRWAGVAEALTNAKRNIYNKLLPDDEDDNGLASLIAVLKFLKELEKKDDKS